MVENNGCRSGPNSGVNPARAEVALANDHREICLFIRRTRSMKRSKVWFKCPFRFRILAIHFVDEHDRLCPFRGPFSTRNGFAAWALCCIQTAAERIHHVITRSTSPPKSACPGVSTILILHLLFGTGSYTEMAVFFRQNGDSTLRSRSLESMTRSATCWFSRNVFACRSKPSTKVVFP
jgi:hypothetical protein